MVQYDVVQRWSEDPYDALPAQLLCPRDFVFDDDFLDDFRNALYVSFGRVISARVKPTALQYDVADYVSRGPTYRMAQAARGIGKSTITQMFIPWRLLREFVYTDGHPSFHAMIMSANRDLADAAVNFIKQLLVVVPEYNILQPGDGQRSSAVAFDVNGARPRPVHSIFSRALFGRITGDRANLIVPDDIEVPSNSETQGMRERGRARAAEFVDLLVPEGGEVVALGTPQTEDTIYNYLMDWGYDVRIWPAEYPTKARAPLYKGRLAPFITDATEADPELEGTPTEPTRFGVEELRDRQKASKARYALQYLLDTSLSDIEKYPLRLADLIVMDLDPGVGPERPVWAGSAEYAIKDLVSVGMGSDCFHRPMAVVENRYVPYDTVIAYVDPSGKGKDETGLAIIGVIGGYIYLLESHGWLAGYDDATLDEIVDRLETFRVQKCVAEPYGGGMFSALLRRKIQERVERTRDKGVASLARPWIGCLVEDGKQQSVQKEKRIIEVVEPVMNQHRLIVSTRVIREDVARLTQHGETYRLFHQMTRICDVRGAIIHDDKLDALAGAIEETVMLMHVEQGSLEKGRQEEAEAAEMAHYWRTNLSDPEGLGSSAHRQGLADSMATRGRPDLSQVQRPRAMDRRA